MKSKDLFPAIFSRHAEAYDRRLDQAMRRGEAKGRQRVIDLVEARPGMLILDLACGPGNLTRRLAALVAPDGRVIGVDLAPGMLDRARMSAPPNAQFELMDIEDLQFHDSSFDGAVCGHGLQFVPHLDRALSEARRVLRSRSPFVASVPAPTAGSVMTLLDSIVNRWLPPSPEAEDRSATRAAVFDPELLQRAASQAGFTSVRVEEIEESVRWESAEQLVGMCSSWWDCAARLEKVEEDRRRSFVEDALATIRARYPGAFETRNRNHILFGVAS
ncbi:MAG TPA: methyltransferase domain-containing protein [Candidatus Dormibacteraeota bacterium]|nr:methyltransferase domain-containing protein [Candidatus Dormibacteraeota bacterium]